MLGRVIEAAPREGELAAHRADVHDLSPSLVAHSGQHQLRQPHEAEHVRVELAAHLLGRDLLDRAALAVAGIVDEHAHGSLGVLDAPNRASHRLFVADVQRHYFAAVPPQAFDRLGPARGRVDLPAALGEALGGRCADSRRAPGDQNCL
jgi:hypothetical protein